MKIKYLLFLLVVVFFSSCTNNEDSFFKSSIVEFVTIGKGALHGNGEEGVAESNVVIRNTNDWENLISQMNIVNNVSDNFSEIEVNFDDFIIVAVFLEIKGSGWDVEIKSVTETKENVFLVIEETAYDSSVITQPFHIIKIPKTNKKVIVGEV
nr:hypothetical protein BACT7_00190 [Tenacibaculum mesophilum]